MQVLVARAADRSTDLTRLLQLENIDVLSVAFMQITAKKDMGGFEPSQSERFEFTISVSLHASEIALSNPSISRLVRESKSLFAVGAVSAQPFVDMGLPVITPNRSDSGQRSDENSDGLLSLSELRRANGKNVVILCGRGGRRELENVLSERGARVTRCELYQRSYRSEAAEDLRQVNSLPRALVAYSGYAASCLARAIREVIRVEWLSLPLVVPSLRVAWVARLEGFKNVSVSDGVAPERLVEQIQKHL